MFSCPIQLRMNDLDPFNHVNNGSQCHIFDYGRTQFFESVLGRIDWKTFDLVIVHLELDFKKPILIHDEIACETEVYEMGQKSIKMEQRLKKVKTGDIMTVCHTVLACIDREANVSKPLPESYRNKFNELNNLHK